MSFWPAPRNCATIRGNIAIERHIFHNTIARHPGPCLFLGRSMIYLDIEDLLPGWCIVAVDDGAQLRCGLGIQRRHSRLVVAPVFAVPVLRFLLAVRLCPRAPSARLGLGPDMEWLCEQGGVVSAGFPGVAASLRWGARRRKASMIVGVFHVLAPLLGPPFRSPRPLRGSRPSRHARGCAAGFPIRWFRARLPSLVCQLPGCS